MRLLQNLNPYHLSETIHEKGPLPVQREIILHLMLLVSTLWGVALLILALVMSDYRVSNSSISLVLPLAVTAGVLVLLTAVRQLGYKIRAYTLATILLLASVQNLFRGAFSGDGMIYGIAFVTVIAVLIGLRAGMIAVGIFISLYSMLGWALVTGRIIMPALSLPGDFAYPASLISSLLAALLLIALVVTACYQLTRGLSFALENQKGLIVQGRKENDLLMDRLGDRTSELARKTLQLEAAQKVAAVLAHETDTGRLLTTSAEVIKENFGFYQVSIFTNDPQNKYTILEASTGDAGKMMLEQKHRLRIGETGIVGYVAASGEPRVTADVLEDANYYPNPLLPHTRAEMALPLRIGEQTVGVLDIQSTIRDAFSPDDVEIIAAIANQVSLALQKSRLIKDLETSFAELEATVRQSTAAVWNTRIHTSRRHYAYQYKHAQVETAPAGETAEKAEALRKGATVISHVEGTEQGETILAVPIKLRNQTIGVMNMRIASAKVSPELVRMVENAINRLAISLENVRLLEELQVRAERERLVGDISSKVRSATDVDTILRTAASEIGRSLGVSEVVVQLNTMK